MMMVTQKTSHLRTDVSPSDVRVMNWFKTTTNGKSSYKVNGHYYKITEQDTKKEQNRREKR
jgi:hypothetical protein